MPYRLSDGGVTVAHRMESNTRELSTRFDRSIEKILLRVTQARAWSIQAVTSRT